MQEPQPLDSLLDTQQKKLAFFQNLVLIAAADGVLDEQESALLLTIGNKLGLTPEDVMPIANNLSVLTFVVPQEGLQKTMELQTLVQMSLQDGEMDEREYALCLEYTYRVGYTKEMLDEMIGQFSGNGTSAGQGSA